LAQGIHRLLSHGKEIQAALAIRELGHHDNSSVRLMFIKYFDEQFNVLPSSKLAKDIQ
jgi:hypothetical protein